MFHRLLGHKKLIRAQRVIHQAEAENAGWKVVKGAEPRKIVDPVLGPQMRIDMWRWVDRKGSFVFLVLLLALASCAVDDEIVIPDIPNIPIYTSADLSQLNFEDKTSYCQAKEDWEFDSCEDNGDNPVIYDEAFLDALSPTTVGHVTFIGYNWTMRVRPGGACPYYVFRHEIGHVMGYLHWEHPWMSPFINCTEEPGTMEG